MTSASDEPMAPADVTSGDVRSPPSDTDERPVRKQLKETSIDSSNNKGLSEDSAPATSAQEQGSGRKRSFEEARGDTDDAIENGDGPRKRSRECTPEDLKKGTNTTAPILDNSTKNHTTTDAMNDDDTKTMKKKRSLEQLEAEGVQEPDSTEKKRHRDTSQESENKTANAFAQSAFASAAASSPFATLGGSTSTSTEKPASTSAFASSALSSFAGSEKSPFGSLGSSKPSVFKSGSGMSGFGSTSTSGFGSMKSGFAGVGGGFAAAAKSGGLTNFASPNAPATIGGEPKPKPAKPIGTEESGDEGSDNEDGEETTTFEADKTDERFFEQTIETGEEEEETLFTCKGKLFHFSGEWKERGVGTFKINARKDDTGKQHGRMIMRADGALRVMLNSPVFKGMTFGDAKNEEPTSKQIFLASNEEGRTVPLLLRVGNEALAKDLYVVIKDLLDDE